MVNKIWISVLALLSVAATTTFVIMYSTTKENQQTVCNERNEMARGDECVSSVLGGPVGVRVSECESKSSDKWYANTLRKVST